MKQERLAITGVLADEPHRGGRQRELGLTRVSSWVRALPTPETLPGSHAMTSATSIPRLLFGWPSRSLWYRRRCRSDVSNLRRYAISFRSDTESRDRDTELISHCKKRWTENVDAGGADNRRRSAGRRSVGFNSSPKMRMARGRPNRLTFTASSTTHSMSYGERNRSCSVCVWATQECCASRSTRWRRQTTCLAPRRQSSWSSSPLVRAVSFLVVGQATPRVTAAE